MIRDTRLPTLDAKSQMVQTLAPGECHAYAVEMRENDFLHLLVEQRGMDVALRCLDPGGEVLAHADSPNGTRGRETISLLAPRAGTYVVEVSSSDGPGKAAPYGLWVEALRPATAEDQLRAAAGLALHQGHTLRRERKHARAAAFYAQARHQAKALKDLALEAEALYLQAWMEEAQNEDGLALLHLREALALAKEIWDVRVRIANRLGRLLIDTGHSDDARTVLEEVRPILERLDWPETEAALLLNLAELHRTAGRSQEAFEAYRASLGLWPEATWDFEKAQTHRGIAEVYLVQEDLDAARDHLEQALELATGAVGAKGRQARREMGVCLRRLGEVAHRSGDPSTARRLLEQALEVREEAGDERGVAATRASLGTVLLMDGELEEARHQLEQARVYFRDHEQTHDLGMTLHKLARVAYQQGRLEEALDLHLQALALLDPDADPRGVTSARFGAARALYGLGRLEEARDLLEEVLSTTARLRRGVESLDLRASYLASRKAYRDLYVDTLMTLHREDPEAETDRVALEAVEGWRARSLLELLEEARLGVREDGEPALLAEERSLVERLADLGRSLDVFAGDASGESPSGLAAREERRLLEDLARVRAEMRRTSPRYEELSQTSTVALSQVQSAYLDRYTQVLIYHLGAQRSYLWRLSADDLESYELPSRREIEEACRAAREQLRQVGAQAAARRRETLHELSEMLLGPVRSQLDRAPRLVLLPDGPLYLLPFSALPDPQGDTGEPLVERHEVVSLPSLSVLDRLRHQLRERLASPAPRLLAVVADPVVRGDDERLPAAARGDQAQGASGSFGRLAYSAAEAESLLALAAKGTSLELQGFAADRERILAGELSPYRFVHFATHGLLDEAHPELSGLLLSRFDSTGKPHNGVIHLYDLYRLNLQAELVTLSACDTGLGPEVAGEGLIGLSRGFLYAGAPRLLVSLWKVRDRGTAELMRRFYRHLLSAPRTPAAALRRTQREMLREEEWSEPAYWAGFSVFGDWALGAPVPAPLLSADVPIEQVDTGGTGTQDPVDDDLPPPKLQPSPSGGTSTGRRTR